jgi:hypothetical protein
LILLLSPREGVYSILDILFFIFWLKKSTKKHISEKLIITIRDLSIEKMLDFNEKGNLIPYSPIKIKLNAPKT